MHVAFPSNLFEESSSNFRGADIVQCFALIARTARCVEKMGRGMPCARYNGAH